MTRPAVLAIFLTLTVQSNRVRAAGVEPATADHDKTKPETAPGGGPARAAFQVYSAWPFGAAEAGRRQEETAKALAVRKQVAVSLGKTVSMKFVLIPAGRFMMGSPGSQHEVTIERPYYLGVYKVTQAQYSQVTGDNPSAGKGKDFPVNNVTWKDAVDFCVKASKVSGKSIHLPNEAQWENACRAGADTKFFWGDDETKLGDYCWYRENMRGVMHAVGLKKPNAFGLYDINGLMWETCRRGEAAAGAGAGAAEDDSAKNYVLRGATFGSRPPMFVIGVTIDAGEDRTPGKGVDHCGMRVMMDATPPGGRAGDGRNERDGNAGGAKKARAREAAGSHPNFIAAQRRLPGVTS